MVRAALGRAHVQALRSPVHAVRLRVTFGARLRRCRNIRPLARKGLHDGTERSRSERGTRLRHCLPHPIARPRRATPRPTRLVRHGDMDIMRQLLRGWGGTPRGALGCGATPRRGCGGGNSAAPPRPAQPPGRDGVRRISSGYRRNPHPTPPELFGLLGGHHDDQVHAAPRTVSACYGAQIT